MEFLSSWFNCFASDTSDTSTLSGVPLMSKPPQKRSSSRYAFKSRSNRVREETTTYSMVADQLNPFVLPVQCTVSARSPYPTRRDLVSINSFVDYDNEFTSVKQNASVDELHLKFRQGDPICILGQYGGMLVGYLEKDSSRSIGFLSPQLVYVDLGSINQIDLPTSIHPPPASYSRRVMTSLPEIH